jgi:hypothetical protein
VTFDLQVVKLMEPRSLSLIRRRRSQRRASSRIPPWRYTAV